MFLFHSTYFSFFFSKRGVWHAICDGLLIFLCVLSSLFVCVCIVYMCALWYSIWCTCGNIMCTNLGCWPTILQRCLQCMSGCLRCTDLAAREHRYLQSYGWLPFLGTDNLFEHRDIVSVWLALTIKMSLQSELTKYERGRLSAWIVLHCELELEQCFCLCMYTDWHGRDYQPSDHTSYPAPPPSRHYWAGCDVIDDSPSGGYLMEWCTVCICTLPGKCRWHARFHICTL